MDSKNLEKIARAQEHFDYLARRLEDEGFPEDVHYDMSLNLKTFLECGFDRSIILRGLTPEDIFYNYDLLMAHDAIIDMEEIASRMTDDFVWEHLGELVERGLDSNKVLKGRRCSRRNVKYLKKFLVEHEDKFLANLATLPEAISADTLVENIPMDDIVSASRYIGLERFIDDFECAGGDINCLSEQFVKEIGYTGRYEDIMTLAQIIDHGGTSGVSLDEFIESIDMSMLDEDDRAFITRILEELE
ncbi:hypothetical protein IKD98_02555 [Candidatus Saccharibacteria bacterium]|nr:hypothetical protein [Candidatus Saccharibacteria bacterium]